MQLSQKYTFHYYFWFWYHFNTTRCSWSGTYHINIFKYSSGHIPHGGCITQLAGVWSHCKLHYYTIHGCPRQTKSIVKPEALSRKFKSQTLMFFWIYFSEKVNSLLGNQAPSYPWKGPILKGSHEKRGLIMLFVSHITKQGLCFRYFLVIAT